MKITRALRKRQNMYPTASFSLAFLLGLALSQTNIAASEPGYLDFDNLPETNFSCEGKVIGGYYADVETGCQMFHVCTIGQKGEITDIKFLCLNGTVFDQETRVCERIDEVDCAKSESFFGLNLELYGNSPAALGVPPEDADCGDDCVESAGEDYSEEADTTIAPSSTTTSTTSTTTPVPPASSTTVSTTTRHPSPSLDFPASSPQTVAALLALHNVYSRPQEEHEFSSPDDPGFGFGERPKPTDYVHGYPRHHHHFPVQKFDFQYIKRSSTPAPFSVRTADDALPQAAVSVVTSTSSSTSVRTSRIKTFPTGYDDYRESDVASDPFFGDVPRLRKTRSVPDDAQFLENLLGSIDIASGEKKKLIEFFEKSKPEMEKDMKEMEIDKFLSVLRDRIGAVDLSPAPREKRQARRNTTEKEVVKPVTELIDEGEFTTAEYRRLRTGPKPRQESRGPPPSRPRTRFDSYQTTTAPRGVNSGRGTGLRSGQKIAKNLSTVRYRKLDATRTSQRISPEKIVPVYENPEPLSAEARAPVSTVSNKTEPRVARRRGPIRSRTTSTTTTTTSTTSRSTSTSTSATPTTTPPDLKEDPNFSCEGKVRGGLYADVFSDCRGFFICAQGKVDEPLLKSHFWCGPATKFNQRSRTCQAERLVGCSSSTRYYHLNDNLQITETEDILLGNFEPAKIQ